MSGGDAPAICRRRGELAESSAAARTTLGLTTLCTRHFQTYNVRFISLQKQLKRSKKRRMQDLIVCFNFANGLPIDSFN